MTDDRDLAAYCERHPHDDRRGPSTIVFPANKALCIQNQMRLGAALARAAAAAHRARTE